MAQHSTRFAIAFAFVSILGSARASAQESPRSRPAEPLVFGTGATYEVKFDDDPLGALSNDVIIPRITVRQSLGSPLLMRPRTQFVVEMLKSVDTI